MLHYFLHSWSYDWWLKKIHCIKSECNQTCKGQRSCWLYRWGSEIRRIENRELILLVVVWQPAAATEGLVIWPTHWLAAKRYVNYLWRSQRFIWSHAGESMKKSFIADNLNGVGNRRIRLKTPEVRIPKKRESGNTELWGQAHTVAGFAKVYTTDFSAASLLSVKGQCYCRYFQLRDCMKREKLQHPLYNISK